MAYVLNGSTDNPAIVGALDSDRQLIVQARVTRPVRVYLPRIGVDALVGVRILDGEYAGTLGLVFRDRVVNDGNGFVLSQTELNNLAVAMSQEWFTDLNGRIRQIPFRYPSDKCWARAHTMADLLIMSGYSVDKLFLFYRRGLRVPTPYGDDLTNLSDQTAVEWWYHVTPTVYLVDDMHPYAIDPALSTAPLLTDAWGATMTAVVPRYMLYDEMVGRLQTNKRYPESPNDQPWMVFAPNSVVEPPDELRPTVPILRNWTYVDRNLAFASDRVPQREAVAALNTLLSRFRKAVDANASKFGEKDPYPGYRDDRQLANIRIYGLSPWDRNWIRNDFRNLLALIDSTFAGSEVSEDINELLNHLGFKAGHP